MQLQKFWLSPPELLDIQREAKSWEAIGAWAPGGQNVGTESEPLRVTSPRITRSLIDVLGVQPNVAATSLKRKIATVDQTSPSFRMASGKRVWRSKDIIGKQIQVNAASTTVVRCDARELCVPPGSNDQVELLVPFQVRSRQPGSRGFTLPVSRSAG
jgi:hypothetical protein